jgi:chromosome segregation ATPase
VNNKTKAMLQYQTRLANKLERELNRLRSRRDDLRADLRTLRDCINTLRRDNVALNGDFDSKAAELQALKHKLALMLERANQVLEEQEMLTERRDEMNAVAKLEATRFEDQRSALLDEIDHIYYSLQTVSAKAAEQKVQEVSQCPVVLV